MNTTSNQTRKTALSIHSYSLVLQRVRDALNARGPNTIRSLGRIFRQMDSYDGNNKIDKDEFLIGLKENGVNITKQEAYVRRF